VPIGKAEVKKTGSDLTIVSYSRMSVVALDVARRLEEEQGISAEVVDLRSLRPLDKPTIIESVQKTGRAVIMEEDWGTYGIGSEIAAVIQEEAFDYLDAPVRRVSGVEVPLPYAKVLERAALPSDKHLLRAIRLTLEGSSKQLTA
jgi:pyruvate dehydrogenase E1 component beta subunit